MYAQGNGWYHVLKGTLSGNQILADWADVPGGDNSPQHRGKIKITILSPIEMVSDDSNISYQLDRIR